MEQARTFEDYAGNFIERVVDGLPAFLGALLLLIIGYFVAKALAAVVRKLLGQARLDDHLRSAKGGNIIQRAVPSPTNLASKLTFWVVFFFAISMAVSALGIPALVDLVRSIYAYIPNVIAAILIFLVASAVSAGIATLVTNTMGDTPTGKVMATSGPVLVMGLAVFMILNQLKIAPEIVTITYAALVGSASLGMALAFGLGGREVASTILQNLYDTSQRHKGDVARDMRKGAHNAKQKTNNAMQQMQ